MSMALAGWLVVKQWSWLADDMGDDGMSWGTENRIFQDKGDRIQGTVNIVEWVSLGNEVRSLHLFVVFDPQDHQKEVLDDEEDLWD